MDIRYIIIMVYLQYQWCTYKCLQRVVRQIAIKYEWQWRAEGAEGDGVIMQSLGPFPTRIVFFFWTREVALN